jgi:hypothetical protein
MPPCALWASDVLHSFTSVMNSVVISIYQLPSLGAEAVMLGTSESTLLLQCDDERAHPALCGGTAAAGHWKWKWKALVGLMSYIAIAVAFYVPLEGWSAVEAAYFAVVTLTTVGYGDLKPTHGGTKLFTCLYVFGGLGCIATLVSKAIQIIVLQQEEMITEVRSQLVLTTVLTRSQHGGRRRRDLERE